MKNIFTMLMSTVLLISLSDSKANAQTSTYSLDITSMTIDDKPALQDRIKNEKFAYWITSNKSGASMISFVGNEVIRKGTLTLVSKEEREKTADSYGGYIIKYIWYSTDDDVNYKSFAVKLRVITTNTTDYFVCDVGAAGEPISQYKGVIRDITENLK